ncbi:hypothetical protein QR685DRAFT_597416 [Neurospora intermedia]|uniref:Uncharacterized protein n=1 Tax=Neurospora intermedia TaxID=5142 RepID=A0ABR3DDU8_NEUIN
MYTTYVHPVWNREIRKVHSMYRSLMPELLHHRTSNGADAAFDNGDPSLLVYSYITKNRGEKKRKKKNVDEMRQDRPGKRGCPCGAVVVFSLRNWETSFRKRWGYLPTSRGRSGATATTLHYTMTDLLTQITRLGQKRASNRRAHHGETPNSTSTCDNFCR